MYFSNLICYSCVFICSGVFVRVKGLPYHEKCFKCKNCGLYLKQKGIYLLLLFSVFNMLILTLCKPVRQEHYNEVVLR